LSAPSDIPESILLVLVRSRRCYTTAQPCSVAVENWITADNGMVDTAFHCTRGEAKVGQSYVVLHT
uniref:MSP domain-containing protein n=1 Tax=Haemonchus placei TaxID=6290 RepID=A0A0N4W4K2_HAEPC